MSFNIGKYTPNNTISRIELIERNIEEIDKSKFRTTKFFLRTGRPGHLFLKPNYTAFTKTNLGSIPSKLEKTLVKTDSNKPLSTYINNTLISFNKSKDFEAIKKEDRDIRTYTTSFSSRGFGVGFVSRVNRFGENLSGYLPGPADYYPEKSLTLLSNVEKSPFGFKKRTTASLSTTYDDSLYNKSLKSKTSSKKKKALINIKEDISKNRNDSDKKLGSYFFTSTSDRFNNNIFGIKNLNPGPGKYFLNNDYIKVKSPDSLSPEFVLPKKKKINPVNYFGLNENDKKKFGFQLINRKKNQKNASIWNKSKFNFDDNLYNKFNKSNISLANNSTRITSLTNNNNSSKIPSLIFKNNMSKMYNNSIKTEYISLVTDNNKSLNLSNEDDKDKDNKIKNEKKKIIKSRKRDHFSLSPPRWDEGYFHDNDSHFQVPGPAYYAPPIQNNKKSFNLNNKDFIFTNSLPFKNDNYGTISSVLI